MDPRASLTGLLVGFLVGLTGMGAGSLMAPLLIVFLHYKAKFAIGSDLAYAAVMKLFGAWQHRRHGNVDTGLSWRLALGSVPASLLGVWWSHSLEARLGSGAEHVLLRILGATLILVSALLVVRMLPGVEQRLQRPDRPRPPRGLAWKVGVGAVIGFLVGLTSVGGGTLFGVAMLVIFGLGARKMVGTDIYHAAILSSAAALGHVAAGNVNYPLVGSLLLGAVPGILLGGRLSLRMPETFLRPTLATVLLLSGLKMI
ncbi:MAG: sulfite exporter TauE/SafE family protein [Armatimonadetes bacterium]|nr:sulfite exporter TauE/SafE family protein [Armatimonadota bacterium]